MTKKKTLLLITFFVLILLTFGIFHLVYRRSAAPRNNFLQSLVQEKDFQRISYEVYDTVFISMFPIDSYAESDFNLFRGMTVLKTDNLLPDFSGFERYFRHITESENPVSTAYLGICPEKVSVEELASLTQDYPSITFEFILAAPSAEYWKKLSSEEYIQTLNAYEIFLTDASHFTGGRFYFYAAEEWLITNPALYLNDLLVSEDAAKFISTNSDYFHPYLLTADNVSSRIASLEQLTDTLRSCPPVYPNLEDTAIVFFGDSIIGNYTGDLSVPGMIHGLTGATVYNCGYSGNSASVNSDDPISLPGIVDAFFSQDISRIPADQQVYQGFLSYFDVPPAPEQKTCFVINYGLNDYFKGYPISSDDPFDTTTYTGAIRTAVARIKEKSANSQIILCTPTFTGYALNESDNPTDIHLQNYVDAVISLGVELEVDVVDNYNTLGIDAQNYTEYLPDLVHPTEEGRFMIAGHIIEIIR